METSPSALMLVHFSGQSHGREKGARPIHECQIGGTGQTDRTSLPCPCVLPYAFARGRLVARANCRGTKPGTWRPGGIGSIDLPSLPEKKNDISSKELRLAHPVQ